MKIANFIKPANSRVGANLLVKVKKILDSLQAGSI
jgi:hypothetical protein